jgi:hypothetical protein
MQYVIWNAGARRLYPALLVLIVAMVRTAAGSSALAKSPRKGPPGAPDAIGSSRPYQRKGGRVRRDPMQERNVAHRERQKGKDR